MKLKILQLLPNMNSGGVERGVLDLASYLVKKKVDVIVASNGGQMVKDLQAKKIAHLTLPIHSKNPFVMIANIFRIKHIIEKHKVNVVHARSRAPAWSAYFACMLTGAKFITTFHGAYSASESFKRTYNAIMVKGERVIAVSSFIKKHIETRYRVTGDKVIVVDRWVDLDAFNSEVDKSRVDKIKKQLQLPSYENLILLPARITQLKGHTYLLNALRLFKHKCTVLIVGYCHENKTEYRDSLMQMINEYNMQDYVFIKDAVSDMPALYSLAKLVIAPSLAPEAFGRTLVEAFAMKVPVIATALGAHCDIIKNGVNGFLCDPNDTYSLVEKLNEVFEIPKKRLAELLNNASEDAKQHYSLEKMCNKTLSIYNELAKEYEAEFQDEVHEE